MDQNAKRASPNHKPPTIVAHSEYSNDGAKVNSAIQCHRRILLAGSAARSLAEKKQPLLSQSGPAVGMLPRGYGGLGQGQRSGERGGPGMAMGRHPRGPAQGMPPRCYYEDPGYRC